MIDRTKLTEEDIEILGWFGIIPKRICRIYYEFDSPKQKQEAENLKQQILEDHDIISNLGVNPRQLIQEWKKKAEKYDALGDIIKQVNELLLEIKHLKELSNAWESKANQLNPLIEKNKQLKEYKAEVERLAKDDSLWNNVVELDNLKQKLEKIEEYLDDKDKKCMEIHPSEIKKILGGSTS